MYVITYNKQQRRDPAGVREPQTWETSRRHAQPRPNLIGAIVIKFKKLNLPRLVLSKIDPATTCAIT